MIEPRMVGRQWRVIGDEDVLGIATSRARHVNRWAQRCCQERAGMARRAVRLGVGRSDFDIVGAAIDLDHRVRARPNLRERAPKCAAWDLPSTGSCAGNRRLRAVGER